MSDKFEVFGTICQAVLQQKPPWTEPVHLEQIVASLEKRAQVLKFHHIEWWCADATMTHKR